VTGSMGHRLLGAALAALLLAGCSAPDADPPPTPEDQPGTGQPDDGAPTACPDDVGAAVSATIAAQLAAFADDDYETALGLAAAGFRASFDRATFRELIETGFPQVADSRDHVVLTCELVDDDVAQATVVVTGVDGTTDELAYLVVSEEGRWVIGAAASRDRAGRTIT
jgi:hypothetical protein